MTRRFLRDGVFYFPENWVEINPEVAHEMGEVVLISYPDCTLIFYSVLPGSLMSESDLAELQSKVRDFGHQTVGNIFGVVDALGVRPDGHAYIIRDHYNLKSNSKGE